MIKVALSVACLFALTACGGDPDQAHCEDYVDAYNAAYGACQLDSSLDKEIQCTSSLGEDNCSQETYYECLRDAPRCEDDGTVTNDPTVCDPSCAS